MRFISKTTLAAAAIALAAPAAQAGEVKVGSIGGVTGPIAELVAAIVDGRNLAAKHVNDQGGLFKGDTYKLVLGDSACDPKAGVDAGNKIVNVEQVVAVVGASTAFFAATVATCQTDIKRVIAYSTCSQLGYMFFAIGVSAYSAGIFHLMTHAFFKALLFLGAGAVIHSMHHALHHTHKDWDAQDMRNMGGLKSSMPITWITMWLATLAIAGVWPFAGFFSKDEIIWMTGAMAGAENAPYPGLYTFYWILALVTAVLTAFYMTRLMVMTFHGANRTGAAEAEHLHEAPKTMWMPSRKSININQT